MQAAREDPRFPPLAEKEPAAIQIEIAIPTIPREIKSLKEFVLGRDGIIINKANGRALFLPEVASKQGWTEETCLQQIALKAGLSADAWRKGARFSIFQAIFFAEEPR
ncbi:MAG: AMMECR1 family protein [Deltaproteobacteria bacterium]|nr:AMMECR1 family protein [Deltaproteobacteria bacterium]